MPFFLMLQANNIELSRLAIKRKNCCIITTLHEGDLFFLTGNNCSMEIINENHWIFVTIFLLSSNNYTRGEGSEENPLYIKHVLKGVDQSVSPT